ncbi:lytic polysaccharide monooxygenase [Thaumasiovibrio subtropicus]|uniref:lytic polysaccharide monooxygenase n=1 Tax=Thaumasiovibrio subtropicus TaxID=1891207 RepID=UPI000B35A676|nr:lytic polysaccharide monooxygenase [Thaumasiovibrio subtropicus]
MNKLTIGIASCFALAPLFANAHGYTTFPKARQVICAEQGGHWGSSNGSTISNLGCRAAFQESGTYPFVQINEFAANVARYDVPEAVKSVVKDGNICSGGDNSKSGMSVASEHWTRTTMAAGQTFTLEFLATAPHNPSYWEIYLSKPGYRAESSRLTWNDLEQIGYVGDIPVISKNNGRYYEFDVTLPAGRTGDATLMVRWQREDPAGEGFYNCSDIRFEGDAPAPVWSAIGPFLKAGFAPSEGESVWFRLFDAQGSELVFEKLPITAQNIAQWQQELATTLNGQHGSLIQVGVADGEGNIQFNAADLYANQVYVTDTQFSYAMDLRVEVVAPDVTVTGIAPNYTLDANNQAVIEAAFASADVYPIALVVKDSQGVTVDQQIGNSPATLSVVVSQAGTYTVESFATDAEGKEWPLSSVTTSVTAPSNGEYDFVFPDGLAIYKAGTKVLGADGGIYECKPFPYEGWCRIYTAAQNHYEPGVGSNWTDAWIKR